ncbi:TIGR03118 family protein [Bryocella elongata]|uniref:TIGR03118 family protein n=1 Tax=Bryocella elongata TaxID=863522 RepID=A0A1H5USP7_9BACT|nr:TIGR03118 family protein [Bryocella elongata]SEF77448.1 TIGR03118 family protein [Bryocella elongata]
MTTQSSVPAKSRHVAALLLKGAAALTLTLATAASVAQTAGSYSITNIISDGYVPATVTDPGFVDPWGISGPSDFWIDTAVTGYSYVNFANGAIQFKTTIPAASGTGTGQPTGTVFNSTTGFMLSNGSKASFLFASLDGSIWGWNGKLGTNGSISLKAIDNSATKAVYTDIALDPSAGGTVLLAANFGAGAKVEVYSQSFASTTLTGSFTDPNVPAGYAPYAIHVISNQVYVTYMLRSTSTYSETLGPNTGFVSVFDVNGNFLKRAITGGNLNAPWGMALAPTGFGIYGGDLLVGNLGDGVINVYDPSSYAYLGQVTDATGAPILSKYPGAGVSSSYVGLWEIVFGNGVVNGTPSTTNAGDPNTLYFAAGLDAETHGVFGAISQNAATGGTTNFGFSTSSPVATVANDASVSLTLAVAPINGFSGPVTFICSGLPANSACTFSSPTLTVTPSASATETLTISTGGYKASNEATPFRHFGSGGYTVLAFMPFASLSLFAGRRKFRIRPKLMLVLIGAVGAATLTGCSYTNPTTPAGTTAITITATSGAVSHTSTVNLTVQ